MISLPSKPKIVEKKDDNEAVFEINSLYPGYGTTIGNSLRRVLLSSLSGAAVTKVKIDGVSHEFSTIEGVSEDVMTILLNLKELRFKVHSDEEQVAKLKVKGETDAKGENFGLPTQLELVNPEAHIATLTNKKSSLEMEIVVEKGMGYSSSEDRKEDKLEVGQIIIDSVFTPVKRSNFYVENMRVGKRTDFDRLFIEVETDRTISPEEALMQAVDTLSKQFSAISSLEGEKEKDDGEVEVKEKKAKKTPSKSSEKEEKKVEKKTATKKSSKKEESQDDVIELPVEELGIPTRTVNILHENRIKKVKSLIKKRESDVANFEGMGEKGIEDIKKALKKKKLELKPEK